MEDPFVPRAELPLDVAEALQWMAENTVEEVRAYREAQTTRIEELGARLRESGACARWLQESDPCIQVPHVCM